MAKRNRARITAGFRQNIADIVRVEMDRMAETIAKFIVHPASAKGPRGAMSIRSQNSVVMSQAGKSRGWSSSYNAKQSGIKWKERDRSYVKKKQRKEWWDNTGELKASLKAKSGKYYEDAFGPVRIRFTKGQIAAEGSPSTSSGLSGRLSKRVVIGRLDVSVMGRITPAMMPDLGTFNPMTSAPRGAGVARLLQNQHGSDDIVAKLMGKSSARGGKPGSHRPAIDPFVSFYLTRAIPNAVYRRIERMARDNSSTF